MRPHRAQLACCLVVITLTFLCISLYLTPSNGTHFRRFSHVDRSDQTASLRNETEVKAEASGHLISPSKVENFETTDKCRDRDQSCAQWRDQGECISSPVCMLQSCRQACGLCMPPMPLSHQVTLNNGFLMPSIGYGTAGLGQQTVQAVHAALLAGYTLFDTAQAPEWYREDLVGQAIQDSNITRSSLFLTTKLHPRHHGFDSTLGQMQTSFTNLHTNWLDLVLLHYPRCWKELCGDAPLEGVWQDSWRALEELVASGQIHSIGVSNFDLGELSELWQMAKVKPAVVQRNSDPLNPDSLVQLYAHLTGMQYQGYSTLGSQWLMKGYQTNPVLNHPAVLKAAADAQRSPAQVVLRWALQHGQAVIPRSAQPDRIQTNLALGFDLSAAAMQSIDDMGEDAWSQP